MKAYCINLKERIDRWEQFNSQDLPMDFERVDAIKNAQGWVGCRESHFKVLENIQQMTLVVEDDCQFMWPWDYVEHAMKQLPDNWNCLYLGANLTRKIDRHSKNLYRLYGGYSSVAIIYHDNIIPKFIIANKDKINRMDRFMVDVVQYHFNCYITCPMIVCQARSYSDITHDNINNGRIMRKHYIKYAED